MHLSGKRHRCFFPPYRFSQQPNNPAYRLISPYQTVPPAAVYRVYRQWFFLSALPWAPAYSHCHLSAASVAAICHRPQPQRSHESDAAATPKCRARRKRSWSSTATSRAAQWVYPLQALPTRWGRTNRAIEERHAAVFRPHSTPFLQPRYSTSKR